MKKLVIFFLLCFSAFSINAKSFFSDIDVGIYAGIGASQGDSPYDDGCFSSKFGLTSIKPFNLFKSNNHFDGYCRLDLAYLHQKINRYSECFTNNTGCTFSEIALPIHAGIRYKIKKFAFSFDFGPQVGFIFGSDLYDDEYEIQTKSINLGIGINLGIRYRNFGIDFGANYGLIDAIEYRINEYKHSSKYNNAHIALCWYFL